MDRIQKVPRSGAHERVDVSVLHSYIQALGLSLNTERPDRSGVFSAGRLLNAFNITNEFEEEVTMPYLEEDISSMIALKLSRLNGFRWNEIACGEGAGKECDLLDQLLITLGNAVAAIIHLPSSQSFIIAFVIYVKDGQTSLTDVIVNMVSGGFYLILNFGLVLKKSAPI
nr:hypothetical transcript [Hymenolepis microstoma]